MIYIIFIIIFNIFFIPFINTPIVEKPKDKDIKAIYWTGYTAGNKSKRFELIKLIEDTELNGVVIDIKDYSGKIFIKTNLSLVKKIESEDIRIPDIAQLLEELHKKGIYAIARIAVFQDPYLAEKRPDLALKKKDGQLWRDFKGLAWVDTSSQEVWDYNISIAKKTIELGFNEVNFDYIRFPSDGNLNDIIYPFYDKKDSKNKIMSDFFEYVDKSFKFSPAYISVDLFGMVLWKNDGLGIGQRLQDAINNFDYISPMVYPSHYPKNFEGYNNPAEYPYEIVYTSLDKGNKIIKNKRAKFRPWLQDFDLGALYDAEMIRKEIKATYDAGWNGWMLWNASNQYTEDALEKDKKIKE